MGWTEPETGAIRVEMIPAQHPQNLFRKLDHPAIVHVFSGTTAYPQIWKVFKEAITAKTKLGFQGETKKWTGTAGLMRRVLSYAEALRIRNQVSFVLAIGNRGVQWYSTTGYPRDKIFEWGYFTQPPAINVLTQLSNKTRFIFAGRISQEKGVRELIGAMRCLDQSAFELHVLGSGPLENEIRQRTQGLDAFKFHPSVPIGQVPAMLSQMDYLILPSTGKDGWGAIVNEALQCGVPCIVSRNAGASDLIIDERMGRTFDPQQPGRLLSILKEIVTNDHRPNFAQREYIKGQAITFSPEAGASYLNAIISHLFMGGASKPIAPWKKTKL